MSVEPYIAHVAIANSVTGDVVRIATPWRHAAATMPLFSFRPPDITETEYA